MYDFLRQHQGDSMLTRRQFCVSTVAAVAAAGRAAHAKALDPLSRPGFSLPANATDCDVHIFDPVRFSYSPSRRYTPPPATVRDLQAFHAALGMQRAVLVQPSVYGTDNRCLLDALKQLGERARGVAAAPGQAVWGSDWPHTGGANRPANYQAGDIELFRTEDDGHHLGMLRNWVAGAAARKQILVDTPQQLYGFGRGWA
jgi:predicted TIM-barrel fold metal-dependent hydrolase